MGRRPVDPLRRLLKILDARFGYLQELLRITVHQRKPRTLYVNHDTVSATERVIHIGQLESIFSTLPGVNGSGFS